LCSEMVKRSRNQPWNGRRDYVARALVPLGGRAPSVPPREVSPLLLPLSSGARDARHVSTVEQDHCRDPGDHERDARPTSASLDLERAYDLYSLAFRDRQNQAENDARRKPSNMRPPGYSTSCSRFYRERLETHKELNKKPVAKH
jgi:hypothetical protein